MLKLLQQLFWGVPALAGGAKTGGSALAAREGGALRKSRVGGHMMQVRVAAQNAREVALPDGRDAARLGALVAPSDRPEGTRPEVLSFGNSLRDKLDYHVDGPGEQSTPGGESCRQHSQKRRLSISRSDSRRRRSNR